MDVAQDQLEAIQFSADPFFEVTRQEATIARTDRLQPLTTVAPKRLVARHALREEQALDAVDVLHPFSDQPAALARDLSSIFLVGIGRSHHRANARLASLKRQQRTDQGLTIEAVGLGAAAPARRGDRGRVNDVAFDPLPLEHSVNPKAVEPRFLDHHDSVISA